MTTSVLWPEQYGNFAKKSADILAKFNLVGWDDFLYNEKNSELKRGFCPLAMLKCRPGIIIRSIRVGIGHFPASHSHISDFDDVVICEVRWFGRSTAAH